MVAVFIIGVIVYLYMRVRRVVRMFGSSAQGMGGARQQDGQRAAQGSTSQSRRPSSSSTSDDNSSFVNEELYDQRSPREANRKIFSKDEGEYVDFVEEKE